MSHILWNVSPVWNSPCLSWNSIYNFVSAIAVAKCKEVWMLLQLRCRLQISGLRRVQVPDWISNRVSTPPKHILAIFVKMMTNRYLYNRQRCIFVSIWFLKFYHQKVKNTFSICSRKQIFDNIKKIIINSFCCWTSFFLLASDPTM